MLLLLLLVAGGGAAATATLLPEVSESEQREHGKEHTRQPIIQARTMDTRFSY